MSRNESHFDALEFKRHSQERIYDVVKVLEPEQELAYYQHVALRGPLGEWWSRIRESQLQSTRRS
jgi:hypothetical protein